MPTPMPMPMSPRSPLALASFGLALLLVGGCGSPSPLPHRVAESGGPAGVGEPIPLTPGTQPLSAAGIDLPIPTEWTVLEDAEPNFALGYDSGHDNSNIPVCSVELRRQGPGPLPDKATRIADPNHGDGAFEYRLGAARGLVRLIPGPADSTIVVHCGISRTSHAWTDAKRLFEAMVETHEPVELPAALATDPKRIAELCTGSPARVTTVCARRGDGAVFCGDSTGSTLERVALADPAVQISCAGPSACARDAKGAVRCWTGAATPELVSAVGAARDIADVHIVDEHGKLMQRSLDEGKLELVELVPLADPALALTDVDRVLPYSGADAGCVLRESALWCWDRDESLHRVGPAADATALQRMDDRLCVARGDRWICVDEAGAEHAFDGCATRPCGCSLIGATRLSCEHQPNPRIDARPLGRIANVIAVAEPCAALLDGTVVCRGPGAANQNGAIDSATRQRVATQLPGIAHVLELR